MFRLVDYAEGSPLYKYLSSISSQTILMALNDLFPNMDSVVDFYNTTFSADVRETDFFEGLSAFIKERAPVTTDEFGQSYSEDARAGIELLFRKTNRMKEKMADPDNYYTFDLFEEYIFNAVIDYYIMLNEEVVGREKEEEMRITAAIRQTTKELIEKYEQYEQDESDPTYASEIAESAWKIEKMGIDDSGSYFWDTDFEFVFQNGFASGIRSLVSYNAAILGYSYEDVCNIFTDCGIKAPLQLVGTNAAFDVAGGVAKEHVAKVMEKMAADLPDLRTELSFDSFDSIESSEEVSEAWKEESVASTEADEKAVSPEADENAVSQETDEKMPSPETDGNGTSTEGAKGKTAVVDHKPQFFVQSLLGNTISAEEVLKRIPSDADSVYVKPGENKAYWVRGEETGRVDLW